MKSISMRRARIPTLFTALVLLASCAFNHDEFARGSNRDILNKLTRDCNRTHTTGCKDLGDDLSGKSEASRLSDWSEPQDPALAKKVYTLCCESGVGECCRAIVEQRLTASPNEVERFQTLAASYGSPMRTPQEIAAEEDQMQASIERKETSLTAERAEEAAQAERDRQAILGATQTVANKIDEATAQHATPTSTPAPTTPSAPISAGTVATPAHPAGEASSCPKWMTPSGASCCYAGTSSSACCTTPHETHDTVNAGHPCSFFCDCGTSQWTNQGSTQVSLNACVVGFCGARFGEVCGPKAGFDPYPNVNCAEGTCQGQSLAATGQGICSKR
jgi:hypothetical protein